MIHKIIKYTPSSSLRLICRNLLLLCIIIPISGCFLPVRFDTEIEITRSGHYNFIFDGYLTKVDLHDSLLAEKIRKNGKPTNKDHISFLKKNGRYTKEQELKKVEEVLKSLRNDVNASDVKYVGDGHFKVHWERGMNVDADKKSELEGDILKEKSVTFLRQSDYIFGIQYFSDTGRVSLRGKSLDFKTKIKLAKRGLGVNGQIRIITDANVISQNATRIKKYYKRGPKFKMYIWDLNDLGLIRSQRLDTVLDEVLDDKVDEPRIDLKNRDRYTAPVTPSMTIALR